MHLSSMQKMAYFADKYLKEWKEIKILDVGSMNINGTYRDIFQRPGWTYHGADLSAGENVDIVLSDEYSWQIPDESYNAVICGQCLEHVEFPWMTIAEMARVLAHGGLCCIIVPSAGPVHRYPLDCYRYYPDGLNALAKWAKLQVMEVWYEMQTPFNDGSKLWDDCFLVAKKT